MGPEDNARVCDLLIGLGEALLPGGQPFRVAEEIAPEAFELSETLGDRDRASRICQLAVDAMGRYGGNTSWGTPTFRLWVERADFYATAGTPSRVLADLGLARLKNATEQYETGWQLLSQALALSKALDVPQLVFDAARLVMGGQWPARYDEEILAIARETAELPERGVNVRTLGQVFSQSGMRFLEWADRTRAEAQWARLAALAERTRDPDVMLRSHERQGVLRYCDGRLEQVVEMHREYLHMAEEFGVGPRAAMAAGFPARALLLLGRPEEASTFINGRNRWAEAQTALQLAHAGRQREASEALKQLRGETVGGPRVLLLETALLLRHQEEAERLAVDFLRSESRLISVTCVARLLGEAAVLAGKAEPARGHYRKALEVCTSARHRPELALTHLELAELLLEHYPDERAEAIEHLDFAIAEFREMKMQPSLERALKHKGLLHA